MSTMRASFLVPALLAFSCGGPVVIPPPSDGGDSTADAGTSDAGTLDAGGADAGALDAGSTDAGAVDAGDEADAGSLPEDGGTVAWRFVPLAGTKCAAGAQSGMGYAPGASDELVIFVQGGGACWNNGTCRPSVFQWGPVCGYGNGVCLWDAAGGTQPLAAFVSHPNPFPADGGGAFPSELASVKNSLLFQRREENPLRNASYVFVPYCTGDLHAGDSTATFQVKADLFAQPVSVTHHFHGAQNMNVILADLRARHAAVRVVWLIGVSGGGYGAQLNLHRVRAAFPEAEVHLLADSAPMVATNNWRAWNTAWNTQLPPGCTDCADAGLPAVLATQLAAVPTSSRVGLLAFQEDAVITRFFYAAADATSWANPPFGTYTTNLRAVEAQYEASSRTRFFELAGQEHVMLLGYGAVQADGGISRTVVARDGGVTLRAWVNAWANGDAGWDNVR